VLAIQALLEKLSVPIEISPYPYARILHSLKTGELDLALILHNSRVDTKDLVGNYLAPQLLVKVVG
jgi:hypothetical protein